MVTNGVLGGRISNPVPGITLMDKILLDKALTDLVHRDKDNGGNQELDGILVLPRIRDKCPLIRNYHF